MVAAAADDDENKREPTLYNLAVILPPDTQMIQLLYCLHAPCNSLYCFVECFSTTHLKYV